MSSNDYQRNKDAVRDFLLAIACGDVDTVKKLTTDDVQLITMGTSIISAKRDRAAMLETVGFLGQVLKPGMKMNFVSFTAEDDRVSCEAEGDGEFVNGTPYRNIYHFLAHLRDGKIRIFKEYIDTKYTDSVIQPLLQPGN